MKIRFKVLAIPLLVAGFSPLLMHCGDPLAGGGTIETTNGMVSGSVLEEEGGQAARTQVQLIPAGFDPVKDTLSIASTLTEVDGRFRFTRVPPGQYNVICKRHQDHKSAMVTGISVAEDTISLEATLRANGSIGVTLSDTLDSEDGYVFIPGTGIWNSLKGGRNVSLDSVPAGTIPRLCYANKKPAFHASHPHSG
jgi:hypothetical protein